MAFSLNCLCPAPSKLRRQSKPQAQIYLDSPTKKCPSSTVQINWLRFEIPQNCNISTEDKTVLGLFTIISLKFGLEYGLQH